MLRGSAATTKSGHIAITPGHSCCSYAIVVWWWQACCCFQAAKVGMHQVLPPMKTEVSCGGTTGRDSRFNVLGMYMHFRHNVRIACWQTQQQQHPETEHAAMTAIDSETAAEIHLHLHCERSRK